MLWYGDVFNNRGQQAVMLLATTGTMMCTEDGCENEGVHTIPGQADFYCTEHFRVQLERLRATWKYE